MPYQSKWVPAALAAAYVVRVEGCDRLDAMRQIETAVGDGALRWVRRGSNRWEWDAEVFSADLLKIWPSSTDDDRSDTAANGSGSAIPTLLDDLKEAEAWHTQPLPKPEELQRATELLAELKESIRQAIRLRDGDKLPADMLEQKFSEAADDIQGETLACLGQGRLVAYIETPLGLERLPNGAYWVYADGGAAPLARRALVEGTAPSNRKTGLAGTVKFRAEDFDTFSEAYKAQHGFGILNRGAGRFRHPIWDLRDVFGWVLDRNPARFGRINSGADWRSAAWIPRFYSKMPKTEFDGLADQTLLHALQRGALTGYAPTSPIPREFWIDKTELTLGACAANFYREEVLALWPDPRTMITRAPKPITPLRGGYGPALLQESESESAKDRKPHRGRRPGSGSIDDSASLRSMLLRLARGEANSVLAAARAIVSEQSKGHSREGDISRLRRKFATRYGTEPPREKSWGEVAALDAN